MDTGGRSAAPTFSLQAPKATQCEPPVTQSAALVRPPTGTGPVFELKSSSTLLHPNRF